jgi:hypothetical protein
MRGPNRSLSTACAVAQQMQQRSSAALVQLKAQLRQLLWPSLHSMTQNILYL